MDPRRGQRVAEALREELSELIALELADPRLDGITVTELTLSPDMRVASVRLAIPGDPARQKAALTAMDSATPFLKRQLAARLELFRMPEFRFEPDMSPELNERVRYLMKKMRKGRPRDAAPVAEGAQVVEKPEKKREP